MKQQNSPDIWGSLTDLGKRFSRDGAEMAKKLKELGLRSAEGKPTEEALSKGFCVVATVGVPQWNLQQTQLLIQQHLPLTKAQSSNSTSKPTNRERNQRISVAGLKANGWTDMAITIFLGEPDEFVPNPHYRSAHMMRLYDKQRVLAAQNSLRFQVWKVERLYRQHRKTMSSISPTEQRYAKFASIYPDWCDALPKACEMMFNLNRYAKHESCSSRHKETIYDLKNKFIQLLYKHGFSTECWQHRVDTAWNCFNCEEGITEYDETCERCHGTGIYQKMLHFICFTFVVNGKRYSWHQPRDLVNFRFNQTAKQKTWKRDESEFEKPITLAANKFAEAKDLLRWTLNQEQQQAVPTLIAQTAAAS